MSLPARRVHHLIIVCFLAILGGFAGLVGSALFANPATSGVSSSNRLPLPHHVPKFPGAVSLRYAMVHDVIHERFPRHGTAYYEERNQRVRTALDVERERMIPKSIPPQQFWELLDDLGVGMERLGQHEQAVALMRNKWKHQEEHKLAGRDLYGTYANLGTFLILWQIQEGFADRAKAKERIGESIELIRKAVEVKPDAHFGREIWQAVLEQFILAVLDTPELLLQYDMVGNRLDKEIDPSTLRSFDANGRWLHGGAWQAQRLLSTERKSNDGEDPKQQTAELRKSIKRVGAEEGWAEKVKTDHREPVPFDEPTLGIIGMWRYGGGANPFFALALGETMMRVGQRFIAWTAFERTAQMAGGIGPDPIPEKLIAHCRQRQKVIEAQLPAAEVAKMRPRFEQELAHGRAYQQAYQDYEARTIKAGTSIDDPHFYDKFLAERGPIATPVGEEDHFILERSHFSGPPQVSATAGLLTAGVFAFLGALLLRYLDSRRTVA